MVFFFDWWRGEDIPFVLLRNGTFFRWCTGNKNDNEYPVGRIYGR